MTYASEVPQGSIINQCYVVSLSDRVEDDNFERLCDEIVENAHEENVIGVIVSFLSVNVIDTYMIQRVIDTTKTISLFASIVVWVGLNPSVITTILDLNLELDSIITRGNIDEGITTIHKIHRDGM